MGGGLVNSGHAFTGIPSLAPNRVISDPGEVGCFNTDDSAQIPKIEPVESFELRCGQGKCIKAAQKRG